MPVKSKLSPIRATRVSSVPERVILLTRLDRLCTSYRKLREAFKKFAPIPLHVYLTNDDIALPRPENLHNPVELVSSVSIRWDTSRFINMSGQIDSANVDAMMAPWGELYITQYIEMVGSKAFDGMEDRQIFAELPSAYETWKIDKEFKDIKAAGDVLRESLGGMEKKRKNPIAIRTDSARDRAKRLRSGGYGTSLGEVISADEDWPEEGWANSRIDLPYAVRFKAKMRNRPFILDSDPTDRSGIASRHALKKLEGR
jgi:hypothetical protein